MKMTLARMQAAKIKLSHMRPTIRGRIVMVDTSLLQAFLQQQHSLKLTFERDGTEQMRGRSR